MLSYPKYNGGGNANRRRFGYGELLVFTCSFRWLAPVVLTQVFERITNALHEQAVFALPRRRSALRSICISTRNRRSSPDRG